MNNAVGRALDAPTGLVAVASPASTWRPISRRSLVEELALRLRERIERQPVTPGERIGTRAELAVQYGVSAATVNAAVRLLDAAGVIEARPGAHGGVFASPPRPRVQVGRLQLNLRGSGNQAIAEESYRSRVLLDILLARLAARYRTADDAEALRASRNALQTSYGQDLGRYMRANWDLHDRIAQAAQDPTLLAIYRALVDVVVGDVERINDVQLGQARDGSNLRLHLRLADAVIAGDVDAATAAAEKHAARILGRLTRRESGSLKPADGT